MTTFDMQDLDDAVTLLEIWEDLQKKFEAEAENNLRRLETFKKVHGYYDPMLIFESQMSVEILKYLEKRIEEISSMTNKKIDKLEGGS